MSKYTFARAGVAAIGKEVGEGQVHPMSAKIAAIAEFPLPFSRSH